MFGRRKSKPESTGVPSAPVDLDALITAFGERAEFWESQAESAGLVRARIADACRDAGIRPVSESRFFAGWNHFDSDQRRRLGLLSSALDVPEVALRMKSYRTTDEPGEAVFAKLQGLAERLEFLTVAVLRESDVRLEEFARHFCAEWGLSIGGEAAAASAARLNDIDFGRLMREAEAARASASERLDYLRKLQEEQEETRRPRRGKW